MGRHTASRASLPAALASAARRGAHGAARVVPGRRRTLGTGAAVAAVALTASTAAAAFADGPASSSTASASAAQATTPSVTTAAGTAATALGAAAADPATVDAASDALVRAQFLTGEGAAGLTPEQIAQIEDARARLSTAVTASSTGGAAAFAGLPALVGSGLAAAAGDTGAGSAAEDDAADDTEGDVLLTAADTLDASVPGLVERGSDRASRSSARTSLDDLTAFPTLDPTVPDLAEQSGETSGEAADAAASADASTESPEEDAAAAESATASPDLTTGTAPDATADAAEAPVPAGSTEEIAALTAELSTLLDAAGSGVTVQVVPGPPSAEEIAAQLDQWAASTAGFGNGQIPASALCDLSFAPGEQLRCDAAHQIEALNQKFVETFGVNLSVTDSYRSYASQVAVKASRGYFAAPPGMSNHGWALALDLGGGIQGYGTAQYEWMRANAPAYGWDNPEWARAGGSKNEPWHWEYGDLS
ncbi:D-alanyl-D-alanine carboxypeptidase family protein [Cellulosimicrobium sp. NPDC055967]|uniref:M15 family metallopeptidase n=1 Tax=Cellulosimicrobium sp. NPDC055967 TaxID=3345670 RepID=UPI0035DF104B